MKQINYLKAFCIISVIILHSIPNELLVSSYAQFHIWSAVPLFVALMGFTAYLSFSKKSLSLKELYSLSYFKKKFIRIIIPFAILFVLTLIIGRLFQIPKTYSLLTLIGQLPITGPGNYYITLLFQFILLSPLLYYLFKRYPIFVLIGSFIINLIAELYFNNFALNSYIYSSSIFRFLFLIILGFYLCEIITENKKPSVLFYCTSFLSIAYLISCNFVVFSAFSKNWRRQLLFGDFYYILLLYYLFKLPPKLPTFIEKIGKASYHIFLIQILYFTMQPFNYFPFSSFVLVPFNIICNLVFGYLFFIFSNKIIDYVTCKLKYNIQK